MTKAEECFKATGIEVMIGTEAVMLDLDPDGAMAVANLSPEQAHLLAEALAEVADELKARRRS